MNLNNTGKLYRDSNDIDISGKNLPSAPEKMDGTVVDLCFDKILPGDLRYGFVPYYYFTIKTHDNINAGHISFKIGMTSHILFCAGHIGYGIDLPYRGHHYAFHACKTLVPFIKTIYNPVLITTDPDNIASIRTIEKLGATFLDLHPIPKEDPNYKKGFREKLRYEWKL